MTTLPEIKNQVSCNDCLHKRMVEKHGEFPAGHRVVEELLKKTATCSPQELEQFRRELEAMPILDLQYVGRMAIRKQISSRFPHFDNLFWEILRARKEEPTLPQNSSHPSTQD